jgi:plasmid stability protein
MATLHVRNVPDAVYERLRTHAEANGRSIGAEAVNLIQAQLSEFRGKPLHMFTRRRRSAAATPFEHFSPRARQVVVDAQDEARELGHGAIGTEHMLLALLRERTTLAARALGFAGIDHATVRDAVEEVVGRGEELPAGELPFTPGSKKALELALRESLDMGDPFIGPEHVQIGVAREEDGLGARILARRDQDGDTLRRCVRALVVRPVTRERAQVRVVELDGDPASWEAALNDVAARGYELVQIVDRRAIFQAAAPSIAWRRPLT